MDDIFEVEPFKSLAKKDREYFASRVRAEFSDGMEDEIDKLLEMLATEAEKTNISAFAFWWLADKFTRLYKMQLIEDAAIGKDAQKEKKFLDVIIPFAEKCNEEEVRYVLDARVKKIDLR